MSTEYNNHLRHTGSIGFRSSVQDWTTDPKPWVTATLNWHRPAVTLGAVTWFISPAQAHDLAHALEDLAQQLHDVTDTYDR